MEKRTLARSIATGLAAIVLTTGLPNIGCSESRSHISRAEREVLDSRLYEFSDGTTSAIKEEGYGSSSYFFRKRTLLRYNENPDHQGYLELYERRDSAGKNIWNITGYGYFLGGANFEDFFNKLGEKMPQLKKYLVGVINRKLSLELTSETFYKNGNVDYVEFTFPMNGRRIKEKYIPSVSEPEPKIKQKSHIESLFGFDIFKILKGLN